MSWKACMRFSSLHVFVSYVTSLGIWVPRIDKFTFETSYPVVLCVSSRLILVLDSFLSLVFCWQLCQDIKGCSFGFRRLCWRLESTANYVCRLFGKSIQIESVQQIIERIIQFATVAVRVLFQNHWKSCLGSWRTIRSAQIIEIHDFYETSSTPQSNFHTGTFTHILASTNMSMRLIACVKSDFCMLEGKRVPAETFCRLETSRTTEKQQRNTKLHAADIFEEKSWTNRKSFCSFSQ